MTAASVHRRRALNALAGAVLFAALAPMITLFVALMALAFHEGPVNQKVGMTAFLFLFNLQIAYMISALPAALAGGCAGYLRHRLHAPTTWMAIGALETTLTLGLIFLTGYLLPFDPSDMVLGAPFFIAGAGCAWLLGRLFAWRDRRRGGEAPPHRPDR